MEKIFVEAHASSSPGADLHYQWHWALLMASRCVLLGDPLVQLWPPVDKHLGPLTFLGLHLGLLDSWDGIQAYRHCGIAAHATRLSLALWFW